MWKAILYTVGVVILSLSAAAGAAFTVVTRDPEGRLDLERLAYAPETISKPILMRLQPHNALLLGSSRVMEIEPEAVHGVQAFNAGFGGATPERIRDFLTAYAEPGTVVVLAFDFFMMNEANTPLEPNYFESSGRDSTLLALAGDRLLRTPQQHQVLEQREYVFNLGTLARALAGQTPGPPEGREPHPLIHLDGQIYNEDKLAYNALCVDNPPGCAGVYQQLYDQAVQGHFGRYVYSEQRVHTFREIRRLLSERRLPYVVLIAPEHRDFLPVLGRADLAPQWARFRSDVSASFENVCDFSDGSFADPSLYYTFDPFHYLPETGALMVNQCLQRHGVGS